MTRTLLLSAFALTASTSFAQNWIVGQQFDTQLSAVTVYGGGCYPAAQAVLAFGTTPVDGVYFYYKVISVSTDGEWTMLPGPVTALSVGDTVHMNPVNQLVFNSGTYGAMQLEVWAEGTPTTAGQAHPCTFSDLWMSNLLLCNEGLSCTIASSCATEIGSGMADTEVGTLTLIPPSPANGFNLQLTGGSINGGRILDLQGRMIATLSNAQQGVGLDAVPNGVYVLDVVGADGSRLCRTFSLLRH